MTTKKSHAKYPVAQLEENLPLITEEHIELCHMIAQNLLMRCEGNDIIHEEERYIIELPNYEDDDVIESFLNIVSKWDEHYAYPKHNSTNGSTRDAHTPNTLAMNRLEANSHIEA